MKIIVPRLPDAATKKELRMHIADVLDKRFHIPFTENPRVVACDILSMRDSQGVVEHHGVVTVMPDSAGDWLLGHFKGQHLKGKLIFARQYFARESSARVFSPEDDRRREGLEISKKGAGVHVQADDQFNVVHN